MTRRIRTIIFLHNTLRISIVILVATRGRLRLMVLAETLDFLNWCARGAVCYVFHRMPFSCILLFARMLSVPDNCLTIDIVNKCKKGTEQCGIEEQNFNDMQRIFCISDI